MPFWYCGDNMYNFIKSLHPPFCYSCQQVFVSSSAKKLRKYYCNEFSPLTNTLPVSTLKLDLHMFQFGVLKLKETYHLLLMESLVVHHLFSIVQYRNLQNKTMFFLLVQILPTDCIQMIILTNTSMNT